MLTLLPFHLLHYEIAVVEMPAPAIVLMLIKPTVLSPVAAVDVSVVETNVDIVVDHIAVSNVHVLASVACVIESYTNGYYLQEYSKEEHCPK